MFADGTQNTRDTFTEEINTVKCVRFMSLDVIRQLVVMVTFFKPLRLIFFVCFFPAEVFISRLELTLSVFI